MLRTLDVVLIGAMVAAAAFTYQVKQRAERQVQDIDRLESRIQLQNSTIDLLKADWSVLTQPSRLQNLIEAYQAQLDLGTIQPTQVATLNDLPSYPKPGEPPLPSLPPKGAPNVAKAAPRVDLTETGSVVR